MTVGDKAAGWLDRVYGAETREALARAYDGWAATYDEDLRRFGYRLPAIAAGLFARHVPAGAAPVLDAGCGTGLFGETLALLGYPEVVGLDGSQGMLDAARRKGVYAALHHAWLGDALDFADGRFAAAAAIGVLTKGHATPDAFDELIRVVDGVLVFSIRVDVEPGTGFLDRIAAHERAGRWTAVAASEPFPSLPAAEPEVLHRVFVYQTNPHRR